MRKYIDIINEENGIEPEKEELNPKDFPHAIMYQDEVYYRTDKLGHDVKTGEPSAHYQTAPKFLWRTKSGKITPD